MYSIMHLFLPILKKSKRTGSGLLQKQTVAETYKHLNFEHFLYELKAETDDAFTLTPTKV